MKQQTLERFGLKQKKIYFCMFCHILGLDWYCTWYNELQKHDHIVHGLKYDHTLAVRGKLIERLEAV